jgi:hypothetical protein
MRSSLATASIAALTVLYACSDATTPNTQADEAFAISVSGSGFDPNAETTGGHTATPPAVTCSFDATTKWTTCGPSTQNGLTVTRQMQFLDGSGTAQQRPDTSTRSMKSKTTVTGTLTMTAPTGTGTPTTGTPTTGTPATGTPATGTTTVNRSSEETVTGLGPSSTQRVVNGTATGSEDSQGTDTRGTMTVKRTYADTTTGMTFPAVFNLLNPFPTAGTVVRNVKSSVTLNGGTPKDYTAREEKTFAAGGKLTVKTTVNGQTRTCVIQLGTLSAPVCTQG